MDAQKIDIISKLNAAESTDIQNFVLRNPFKLTPEQLTWAANYLHFRGKIKDKIPAWSNVKTLEPLPTVSIEQSSSQLTAEYKAALIPGVSCLDLTGGMGIDSYFFAQRFKKVTYVEQNTDLVNIATHNFKELRAENIETIHQHAEVFLRTTNEKFDLIYLDPARRDELGGKVFFIEDCSPDVSALLPDLFTKTTDILVKYAPMLDIKAAIATLKSVYKVMVIAIDNEVKEVLYWLKKNANEPVIEAINLSKENQQAFKSFYSTESDLAINFNLPKSYLYEPNAAILKTGFFKAVAQQYNLDKLATNTHLYTNDALQNQFPGRKFRINRTEKFNKKSLRKELNGTYANISCRNFPLKPEILKKLLNYKDGGEVYIFFTQNHLNEKIAIFTTKISD